MTPDVFRPNMEKSMENVEVSPNLMSNPSWLSDANCSYSLAWDFLLLMVGPQKVTQFKHIACINTSYVALVALVEPHIYVEHGSQQKV